VDDQFETEDDAMAHATERETSDEEERRAEYLGDLQAEVAELVGGCEDVAALEAVKAMLARKFLTAGSCRNSNPTSRLRDVVFGTAFRTVFWPYCREGQEAARRVPKRLVLGTA
jgi:hypothetical protein